MNPLLPRRLHPAFRPELLLPHRRGVNHRIAILERLGPPGFAVDLDPDFPPYRMVPNAAKGLVDALLKPPGVGLFARGAGPIRGE
jgi:hypothetical protein